jgi:alpha-mannosidase
MPTILADVTAAYEIPYGVIERPADGAEEPGQRWIDASGTIEGVDGRLGLAVLNDGKYGFDILDGELGVTAVRSPIYAHHEPTVPTEGVRYQFQDLGLQRFTLWLVPHRGDWQDGGLTRRALELNQRPTLLVESSHAGPLGRTASFVSVEPERVIVGAVKQAEDGDDIVIRLAETTGRAATARVRFPAWGGSFETEIGPFEVRTFRVPAGGSGEAVETDLLERRLEQPDDSEAGLTMPARTQTAAPGD